jgi:hypothetical protein
MRRNRTLFVLVAAACIFLEMGCGTVRSAGDQLSLDGYVVVKAVDDERVIVAIDTSNEGRAADGIVDHVFLFTASESIRLPDLSNPHRGHLEFSGNMLVEVQDTGSRILEFVVPNESSPVPTRRSGAIRFDKAIGLSHYTGWKDSFRFGDLDEIRRDDQRPDCYWVGDHRFVFPA